jgi:succinyl-diaminopimelate desuccinylase
MDMRILPRYPVKDVLGEIDRIKGEVAAKHKVTIEYSLPQTMESPPTPADAPLVKALSAAVSEVYGVKPRPVGIGGGTVAAHLRKIGIDCAVWAKLGDCAHQPDEYVLLENISGDAKVMATLLIVCEGT